MKLVVEALLVIYLFYLGSKLILIDIRKPFWSSTCLDIAWSLPSCGVRACESPPKHGLYSTHSVASVRCLPVSINRGYSLCIILSPETVVNILFAIEIMTPISMTAQAKYYSSRRVTITNFHPGYTNFRRE